MTEKFKRWVCDKINSPYSTTKDGFNYELSIVGIDALVKCMWKINRGDVFTITMDKETYCVFTDSDTEPDCEIFFKYEYNDSESEALIKALEYIMENEI